MISNNACSESHDLPTLTSVRNLLPSIFLFACNQCQLNSHKESSILNTDLWLCFGCGFLSCFAHQNLHSDICTKQNGLIALLLRDNTIRCFSCDEKISTKGNIRWKKIVDYIQTWYKTKFYRSLCQPDSDRNCQFKGLVNMGKTCYMNCILQCLAHTPNFIQYLESWSRTSYSLTLPQSRSTLLPPFPDKIEETSSSFDQEYPSIDLQVEYVSKPVTEALCRICTDIVQGKPTISPGSNPVRQLLFLVHQKGSQPVSPHDLQEAVSKHHPRFDTNTEQDCQEWFITLIDLLNSEELHKLRAAILHHFGIPRQIDPTTVNKELKSSVKHYGFLAARLTIWEKLFCGSYISSLTCTKCGDIRTNFESFNCLYLGISESKTINISTSQRNTKRSIPVDKNIDSPINPNPPENDCLNEINNVSSDFHGDCECSTSDTNGLSECEINGLAGDSDSDDLKAAKKLAAQSIEIFEYGNESTNLEQALYRYFSPELICGFNSIQCRRCKISQSALSSFTKHDLIYSPPNILPICLKRLQSSNRNTFKLKRHLSFPTILNMKPFCSKLVVKSFLNYRLYAVIEHDGSYKEGHFVTYFTNLEESNSNLPLLSDSIIPNYKILLERYKNYVGNPSECAVNFSQDSQSGSDWYCCYDEHVIRVTESFVLNSNAYMLFYQLIDGVV